MTCRPQNVANRADVGVSKLATVDTKILHDPKYHIPWDL